MNESGRNLFPPGESACTLSFAGTGRKGKTEIIRSKVAVSGQMQGLSLRVYRLFRAKFYFCGHAFRMAGRRSRFGNACPEVRSDEEVRRGLFRGPRNF